MKNIEKARSRSDEEELTSQNLNKFKEIEDIQCYGER